MNYLAVVDLGSNSTRMVVEEQQADGTFVELRRRKIDTRLAEGMAQNHGALTQSAMQRVEDALREFELDYQSFPNVEVIGIATAAVREATNQQEFLDRVYQAVGVEVRVLTGDQEAYYDYLGACSALNLPDAWLLDTGGASVELVGIEDRMATSFVSLPFGAVNLAERFHLNGEEVIDERQLAEAQEYVRSQYEDLPWLDESVDLPIILLGGANRSLARMDGQQKGLPEQVELHGYTMTADAIFQRFHTMAAMTRAERAELLGAEANRADIIIAGMLPLVELIIMTGAREVIFSSSGVREGILQEYRLSKK